MSGRPAADGRGGAGYGCVKAERRLIVMRIEPEVVAGLDDPNDGLLVDLGPPIDAYGTEWNLISHTFCVQPTGEALLSVLFERLGEEAR